MTAHPIPASTVAAVTYASRKLGCVVVDSFDLYHLMRAAGLPITYEVQTVADARGWDEEATR